MLDDGILNFVTDDQHGAAVIDDNALLLAAGGKLVNR
jgi:hypothetical protein